VPRLWALRCLQQVCTLSNTTDSTALDGVAPSTSPSLPPTTHRNDQEGTHQLADSSSKVVPPPFQPPLVAPSVLAAHLPRLCTVLCDVGLLSSSPTVRVQTCRAAAAVFAGLGHEGLGQKCLGEFARPGKSAGGAESSTAEEQGAEEGGNEGVPTVSALSGGESLSQGHAVGVRGLVCALQRAVEQDGRQEVSSAALEALQVLLQQCQRGDPQTCLVAQSLLPATLG